MKTIPQPQDEPTVAAPEPEVAGPRVVVQDADPQPPAAANGRARPEITDAGWSEYVIDQLDATEIDERGSVTTDGLRRIAPLLLGKMLRSGPSVASVPGPDNNNRATVLWEIVYRDRDDDEIHVSDIAGVTLDRNNRFSQHAEASAATKAEGRALKKALRLRRVYTSEEMAESNASPDGDKNGGNGDLIALTQVRFIETKCGQLDIDPAKFIKMSGHGPFAHYNQVPAFVAAKMIRTLNDWQQDATKIPGDVKGFDREWRKSF